MALPGADDMADGRVTMAVLRNDVNSLRDEFRVGLTDIKDRVDQVGARGSRYDEFLDDRLRVVEKQLAAGATASDNLSKDVDVLQLRTGVLDVVTVLAATIAGILAWLK